MTVSYKRIRIFIEPTIHLNLFEGVLYKDQNIDLAKVPHVVSTQQNPNKNKARIRVFRKRWEE